MGSHRAIFFVILLDMATILRLPHMDIVLDGGDSPRGEHKVVERRLRRRSSGSYSIDTNVRRSSRIKNNIHHQPGLTQSDIHQKRRRYNSVMDDQNDDEEEMEDIESQEPKRREPEHRQLNRMRLQRQNVNKEYFKFIFKRSLLQMIDSARI